MRAIARATTSVSSPTPTAGSSASPRSSDTDTATVDDGSDTLTSIEGCRSATSRSTSPIRSSCSTARHQLVGTFATIQEAIDAASDDYTIRVAAGTYDEDLVIDVGVTILGAQADVGGRRPRRGGGHRRDDDHRPRPGHGDRQRHSRRPSLPQRRHHHAAAARAINFLRPAAAPPATSSPTRSSGRPSRAAPTASTIARSRSSPIADGLITITDNLISGTSQGQFGTASWGRGIWFDGGGVDLVVTGNAIEWTRTGLNLDMSGDSDRRHRRTTTSAASAPESRSESTATA